MHPAPVKINARHELPNDASFVIALDSGERLYRSESTGTVYSLQRPKRATPSERCDRLVEQIAELSGRSWTFGYIGNCDHVRDDRSWYAFDNSPNGRNIGGFRTRDLDRLVTLLSGVVTGLRMAR